MNKKELFKAINNWLEDEFESNYTEITEDGIINIATTNAEYNEDLLFVVDIDTRKNEIIWIINNYEDDDLLSELIFEDKMKFNSSEEMIEFLNEHSFDDILSDEYFAKSGISKYEE